MIVLHLITHASSIAPLVPAAAPVVSHLYDKVSSLSFITSIVTVAGAAIGLFAPAFAAINGFKSFQKSKNQNFEIAIEGYKAALDVETYRRKQFEDLNTGYLNDIIGFKKEISLLEESIFELKQELLEMIEENAKKSNDIDIVTTTTTISQSNGNANPKNSKGSE